MRNETCYFPFVIAIFCYYLHRSLQCSNDGKAMEDAYSVGVERELCYEYDVIM